MVGPEGMEKFCEDIGVEPENVSPHGIFLHGKEMIPVCQSDMLVTKIKLSDITFFC